MSQKTVAELEKLLREASDAYYNSPDTLMSDSEFDELRDELSELDPKNKFLKQIGAPIKTSVWPKIKHDVPMGSLLKVNTETDFRTWMQKYTSGQVVGSEKLDGSSIDLRYKGGKFYQGVTRGDGTTGDDITKNVLKMDFPKSIKFEEEINIRGEIILLMADWKENFPDDKNPRNSAAGSCRRLDGKGCQHLRVVAFDIVGLEFETELEKMDALEEMGFMVPYYELVDVDGAQSLFDKYVGGMREKLQYEIDGMVFKDNDLNNVAELGYVDGRPRAHRAYKFPPMMKTTILKDVVWQVGRTGIVTPVGVLDPVEIGGVTISRVHLCNLDELKRLNAKVGSQVTITRRNDVIPKVEKAEDTKNSKDINIPEQCPVCESDTYRGHPNTDEIIEEGVHLICSNERCPGKKLYSILNYVRTLDVKGLGERLASELMNRGKLKDIPDLYNLTPQDFSEIEGQGEKHATKVLIELKSKSEGVSSPLFIKALGIPLFGKSFSALAIDTLGSFEKLLGASEEDLVRIPGIGDSVAKSAVKGLADRKEMIKQLLNHVVLKADSIDGPLAGNFYCFTGFRNKEYVEKIEDLGGKMTSSVTKKTTHLVVKDKNSMSQKAQKARDKGVNIIDIADLLEVLEA